MQAASARCCQAPRSTTMCEFPALLESGVAVDSPEPACVLQADLHLACYLACMQLSHMVLACFVVLCCVMNADVLLHAVLSRADTR